MEEKLKKQRNKLFLRIILIMLGVWLLVSVVFCAVRLEVEKVNVQNSGLATLSYTKQLLTIENGDQDSVNLVFIENSDFVYDKSKGENDFNSQFVFTDRKTGEVVADTAETIGIKFSVKNGADSSQYLIGLLGIDDIKNALSEEQLGTIHDYLNAERGDGNYYELVCTKFYLGSVTFMPLELKIVLTDGRDSRFVIDENIETFELSKNIIEGEEVYQSSEVYRNIIPKEFLFDGAYNRDYIGALTKEQRKTSADMIPMGAFKYVFYAKDYINYDNSELVDTADDWFIEYAKEVNILDNSKFDLLAGVLIVFAFFLIIAVILCVMIWQTVKTQIVQEQKRLDLTNALAHDIKTPLFVISGYAYSLKENIDETERDSYLDKIIEQTDEVNALVHKMLSFSKLDSYNMTLNKTDFDLSDLTAEILRNYTALPDNKQIEFTHSGKNIISADRELLKTALQNLIDNAVQYSPGESEVKIAVEGSGFTISNQSEEITKDELKRLWQPYFRKDKSRRQKGNGLGLSIVKSILDLHGAKYNIEMKDSVFSVKIGF